MELEAFIKTKAHNSTKTISNYVSDYKLVTEELNDTISNSTENNLLKALTTIAHTNPNKEMRLIGLIIMIRQQNNQPINALDERRYKLKKLIEAYTENSKETLNETLPDYQTIVAYINKLYADKKYKEYVVNWLMLTYGVRNMDLNAYIVDKAKDAIDVSTNYLIVKKTLVEWRINNYKTFSAYGPKIIKIKNKQFIKAIQQLPVNTWLLTGTTHELANTSSVGLAIKRMLYDGLSETDYFKIVVREAKKSPEVIGELQRLSFSRGTDLQTLINSYDIS